MSIDPIAAAFAEATTPIPDIIAKFSRATTATEIGDVIRRIADEGVSAVMADDYLGSIAAATQQSRTALKSDLKKARSENTRKARCGTHADGDWPATEDTWPARFAEMNAEWSIVTLGGKVRFAQTCNDEIRFYDKGDFNTLHENKRVDLPTARGRSLVSAAALWLREPKRRQYDGVTFCPACDPDTYTGNLNLFRGYGVEGKAGDWGLLRTHILDNICQGNDEHFTWLMSWMAQLLQNPGEKMGTSVVFRGKQGVGKSILAKWLKHLIGKRHAMSVTQVRHVTGNFNAHQAQMLLLVSEEAVWAGDKSAQGVLNDLITGDAITLEKKGVDPLAIPNFTRVVFISNEEWIVPANVDSRRFFVLDVGEAQKQKTAYFEAIMKQMEAGGAEAMMHDLMEYDWQRVDLRNPPKTDALRSQIEASLDPFHKWLASALDEGGFYGHDGTFHDLHEGTSTKVPKSVVYASARQGLGGTYTQKNTAGEVTKRFRELFGDAVRTDAKLPPSAGRAPAYDFAPLDELRKAFDKATGLNMWPYACPGSAVERDF